MKQAVYAPGEKTHANENFPVASYIISAKYRAAILAFYTFARAADDVADHPDLSEQEKVNQLDEFEATLLGQSDEIAAALPLRENIAARGLSPRHGLDLLIAFRQDARKARYQNWDELLHYCAYSAAPVGRFVLEVHGEDQATWPASDALCSVLQIINHLQDCQADYLWLNRVYIPQDALARHGISEEALAHNQSSPALRECLVELVQKTQQLMRDAHLFPQVRDARLCLEVLTIEKIAHRLLAVLLTRDPLNERVHLNKFQFISVVIEAVLATIAARGFGTGKTI